jgi:hypothetical protein
MIQTKRRERECGNLLLWSLWLLSREAKVELGLMTDLKASALNEAAEGLLVKMRPDVNGWTLEKQGS